MEIPLTLTLYFSVKITGNLRFTLWTPGIILTLLSRRHEWFESNNLFCCLNPIICFCWSTKDPRLGCFGKTDPQPQAPHEEASSRTPGRNVAFWALTCTASLRQALMRLMKIFKRLWEVLPDDEVRPRAGRRRSSGWRCHCWERIFQKPRGVVDERKTTNHFYLKIPHHLIFYTLNDANIRVLVKIRHRCCNVIWPVIRFFHYDIAWFDGSGQSAVQISVSIVSIKIIFIILTILPSLHWSQTLPDDNSDWSGKNHVWFLDFSTFSQIMAQYVWLTCIQSVPWCKHFACTDCIHVSH